MAITWELKITPINISTYEASIVATRTDSNDPGIPMIYKVHRAKIETPEQQLAVADEIWTKHQARLASDVVIENFVSELEALGKSNLEARE